MIQNSTTTPPNEDSLCQPIIQLMSSVNQQQMRVRKPSESSENRLTQSIPDNQQIKITNPKSPSLTQITLQLASDRASPHNANDLLLIQEEPSMKEDSQQQSMFKRVNDSEFLYRKSLANRPLPSRSSCSLLFRDINYAMINPNLTKKQFQIINDLGAEYIVRIKDQIKKYIKKDCILKQIVQGFYVLFLIFYLTILLIEIGCDNLQIANSITLQYLMLITQLLDTSYKLIIHSNKYLEMFLDLLTIIPFIAFQMKTHQVQTVIYLLFLFRIRKISNFISQMHFYSTCLTWLFILKSILQLHFATYFVQTIIYLFSQSQSEVECKEYIENIFGLVFSNPPINIKYIFIIYLARALLLGFYLYNLKLIFDYKVIEIDNSINYKPKIQESILQHIQTNDKVKFDINSMPRYLQQKMKRQKYLNTLKNIKVFTQSFSHQTMLNICDMIKEISLESNETLEQDSSLFIHLEGTIDLILKCEEAKHREFVLKRMEQQFEVFNNLAFFKNQMQGLKFQSIGVSKIGYINQQQFYQLIRQCPRELQKYRMLIDTIIVENDNSLANITCFICQQSHDITQCPTIHYMPNKNQIIQRNRLYNDQKRVSDFKRLEKKKKRIQAQPGDDSSGSFESEKQDLVIPFDKILPSQNSSISINNNNNNLLNFNQLELSSVPYMNYSHSGQTLYSKKIDSENFFSLQGVSSSQGNSSRKIILNEFKEVGQSKFERFNQAEEQSGSSFQINPKLKVQDSYVQNKKRTSRTQQQKQDQLQRYQTDLPFQHQNRGQKKNNTIAHSLIDKKRGSLQQYISIEDNFVLSFERISRFDDYFPHYNVDQQINNYQRIQSINNNQ